MLAVLVESEVNLRLKKNAKRFVAFIFYRYRQNDFEVTSLRIRLGEATVYHVSAHDVSIVEVERCY